MKLAILGTSTILLSCLAVGGTGDTQDKNRLAMQRWVQMWEKPDVALADSFIAPDFVRFHPRDERIRDRAGMKQLVRHLNTVFPDFTVKSHEIEVTPTGGRLRWVVTGTHTGPGEGPPTGNAVEISGSDAFVIEDGMITMNWGSWDNNEFFAQLGVPPMPPRAHTNLQTSLRWPQEVHNGGKHDVIGEVFTADTVLHRNNTRIDGLAGIRAHAETVATAFPDFHLMIDREMSEGDLVAAHWVATGTHHGDFHGVAATGKKVRFSGLWQARMENGKVAETWLSWDTSDLFRQLGARPAAAAGGSK